MSANDNSYYGTLTGANPNTAPLTGVTLSDPRILFPPIPRVETGQMFYNTETEEVNVFDGTEWIPLTQDAKGWGPKPVCGRYKGRKARYCTNCEHKYVEHEEGQALGMRERLLALQKKVSEL